RTATPPAGTATPCPIQFTDVAVGSTFYDNIRCLTCRGIVGGYTDAGHCPGGAPCFQPGANVTRGQTAKFIRNAFFPGCVCPLRR
ncbi:MAG: S-layer homology domain-containing protein, partial [Chloroflexota bacterium]|nr:S-layer homology domain-containing protein [Chloroflexota bacterium]